MVKSCQKTFWAAEHQVILQNLRVIFGKAVPQYAVHREYGFGPGHRGVIQGALISQGRLDGGKSPLLVVGEAYFQDVFQGFRVADGQPVFAFQPLDVVHAVDHHDIVQAQGQTEEVVLLRRIGKKLVPQAMGDAAFSLQNLFIQPRLVLFHQAAVKLGQGLFVDGVNAVQVMGGDFQHPAIGGVAGTFPPGGEQGDFFVQGYVGVPQLVHVLGRHTGGNQVAAGVVGHHHHKEVVTFG
jgi:hypothetical protein